MVAKKYSNFKNDLIESINYNFSINKHEEEGRQYLTCYLYGTENTINSLVKCDILTFEQGDFILDFIRRRLEELDKLGA